MSRDGVKWNEGEERRLMEEFGLDLDPTSSVPNSNPSSTTQQLPSQQQSWDDPFDQLDLTIYPPNISQPAEFQAATPQATGAPDLVSVPQPNPPRLPQDDDLSWLDEFGPDQRNPNYQQALPGIASGNEASTLPSIRGVVSDASQNVKGRFRELDPLDKNKLHLARNRRNHLEVTLGKSELLNNKEINGNEATRVTNRIERVRVGIEATYKEIKDKYGDKYYGDIHPQNKESCQNLVSFIESLKLHFNEGKSLMGRATKERRDNWPSFTVTELGKKVLALARQGAALGESSLLATPSASQPPVPQASSVVPGPAATHSSTDGQQPKVQVGTRRSQRRRTMVRKEKAPQVSLAESEPTTTHPSIAGQPQVQSGRGRARIKPVDHADLFNDRETLESVVELGFNLGFDDGTKSESAEVGVIRESFQGNKSFQEKLEELEGEKYQLEKYQLKDVKTGIVTNVFSKSFMRSYIRSFKQGFSSSKDSSKNASDIEQENKAMISSLISQARKEIENKQNTASFAASLPIPVQQSRGSQPTAAPTYRQPTAAQPQRGAPGKRKAGSLYGAPQRGMSQGAPQRGAPQRPAQRPRIQSEASSSGISFGPTGILLVRDFWANAPKKFTPLSTPPDQPQPQSGRAQARVTSERVTSERVTSELPRLDHINLFADEVDDSETLESIVRSVFQFGFADGIKSKSCETKVANSAYKNNDPLKKKREGLQSKMTKYRDFKTATGANLVLEFIMKGYICGFKQGFLSLDSSKNQALIEKEENWMGNLISQAREVENRQGETSSTFSKPPISHSDTTNSRYQVAGTGGVPGRPGSSQQPPSQYLHQHPPSHHRPAAASFYQQPPIAVAQGHPAAAAAPSQPQPPVGAPGKRKATDLLPQGGLPQRAAQRPRVKHRASSESAAQPPENSEKAKERKAKRRGVFDFCFNQVGSYDETESVEEKKYIVKKCLDKIIEYTKEAKDLYEIDLSKVRGRNLKHKAKNNNTDPLQFITQISKRIDGAGKSPLHFNKTNLGKEIEKKIKEERALSGKGKATDSLHGPPQGLGVEYWASPPAPNPQLQGGNPQQAGAAAASSASVGGTYNALEHLNEYLPGDDGPPLPDVRSPLPDVSQLFSNPRGYDRT